MKTCIFSFALTVLSAGMLLAQDHQPEVHEEWRLKKEEDGVRVFTRWIDAFEQRKARQMRIEMTVNATAEDVIAVIKADNEAIEWMNRAKIHYHFDIQDTDNWYTYTQMSVPWPFSNRDLVLKNSMRWSQDRSAVHIALTGVPDHLPEERGVRRIEHFEGCWNIERQASGTVKVRYEIFTKSEPVLPRWIIDPIVEQGFWDTLHKMRISIREYTKALARGDDK